MEEQKAKKPKSKKGLIIAVAVVLTLALLYLVGSGVLSGSGKPTSEPKGEQAPAETQVPVKSLEIFTQDNAKGLKKDGQVVLDPIWMDIQEVRKADTVLYILTSKKSDPNGIGTNVYRCGIADADGKVVVDPVWHYIRYEDLKASDGNVIGSHYIAMHSLNDRSDLWKVMDIRTWQIECELNGSVHGFYDDNYLYFTRMIGGMDTNATATPGGLYDIKNHKELYWTPKDYYVKSNSFRYYPGIGFTRYSYADGLHGTPKGTLLESMFFALNGNVVDSPERNVELDFENNLVLSEQDPGRYWAYDFQGTRIGDFYTGGSYSITVTADGRKIQFANSDGHVFLFCRNDHSLTEIPGAVSYRQFSEGFAAVCDANDKWTYIDDRGNLLCGFQFDEAKDFSGGHASVVMGYSLKTIDTQGNIQ